ncbi:uncharacterized protein LOC116338646 [Contarinia nasturtii]|uniref:uncharacterized protein LOC116338646 n=1 Tax=Contarinia nasturtii TaxID=265458 RepID=UPI0012D38F5F|nr:uncharacterized protein LOC116338646 [Contarinia nasturtii]
MRTLISVLTLIGIIELAQSCYVIHQLSGEETKLAAETLALISGDVKLADSNVTIISSSNIIECLGLENELQKIHISWTGPELKNATVCENRTADADITVDENIVVDENATVHCKLLGVNVTVESIDKDFFATKFIPLNESEAAFGVMISPSRVYIVRIEGENRTTSLNGFQITNERPCHEMNPYLWLFVCAITISLTALMTFKKQNGEENPTIIFEETEDEEDDDDAEKKLNDKKLEIEDNSILCNTNFSFSFFLMCRRVSSLHSPKTKCDFNDFCVSKRYFM